MQKKSIFMLLIVLFLSATLTLSACSFSRKKNTGNDDNNNNNNNNNPPAVTTTTTYSRQMIDDIPIDIELKVTGLAFELSLFAQNGFDSTLIEYEGTLSNKVGNYHTIDEITKNDMTTTVFDLSVTEPLDDFYTFSKISIENNYAIMYMESDMPIILYKNGIIPTDNKTKILSFSEARFNNKNYDIEILQNTPIDDIKQAISYIEIYANGDILAINIGHLGYQTSDIVSINGLKSHELGIQNALVTLSDGKVVSMVFNVVSNDFDIEDSGDNSTPPAIISTTYWFNSELYYVEQNSTAQQIINDMYFFRTIKYDDGDRDTNVVDITKEMLTQFDTSTLGKSTAILEYQGVEYSFEIQVYDPENLQELFISSLTFDYDSTTPTYRNINLVAVPQGYDILSVDEENYLTIFKDDATIKHVYLYDEQVTITGYNSQQVGIQTITISYKDLEYTQHLVVYDEDNIPTSNFFIGEDYDDTGNYFDYEMSFEMFTSDNGNISLSDYYLVKEKLDGSYDMQPLTMSLFDNYDENNVKIINETNYIKIAMLRNFLPNELYSITYTETIFGVEYTFKVFAIIVDTELLFD